MPDPVVNIPVAHFEEMAAAPLKIAQIEAADMMRRGDVAGANQRIADGVAKSAAMRAQVLTQQQAAPAQPAAPTVNERPAAAPGLDVPGFVQNPRTAGEAMMARAWRANQEKKAAEAGRDPRRDPTLPFFLGRSQR